MKSSLLRWGNVLLYFAFCILAATGLLLEYRTPLDEGSSATVLGIEGENWGEIHLAAGLSVMALIVFHLWLNWQWVNKVLLGRHLWTSVSLIALGMAMIIGLLLAPVQSIDGSSECNSEEFEEEH